MKRISTAPSGEDKFYRNIRELLIAARNLTSMRTFFLCYRDRTNLQTLSAKSTGQEIVQTPSGQSAPSFRLSVSKRNLLLATS